MTFSDIDAVAAHYDALLEEHGLGRRAVGWETAHGQISTFLQVLRLDGFEPGVSVLDLGCGLAHFKDFLDARDFQVEYTGWDISQSLIDQARTRHPGTLFELRDILSAPPEDGSFDFVVSSGAMNMRLPEHDAWLADMIRALFAACRRGLYFNLLSADHMYQNPHTEDPSYFYALAGNVLAYTLELSPQVLLDHNELAHSFSVYMYRNNQAPMARTARALGLGQRFTDDHRAVSEHYESFDMYPELIAYLETLEPSAELHDHIGLIAFQAGDRKRQLDAFRRAVELAPENPRYLEHLAITYTDAGDLERALPVLRQAHALAPDDEDIARRLAAVERALA